MKKCTLLFILLPSVLWLISGCGIEPKNPPEKKEILIYCGITMVQPIQEIARIIEQRHNCVIKIIKGASGTLLNSIKVNKAGDLYLPGSESYINTCLEENLVTETRLLGYNRAALIVRKGNPLAISADIANLLNPDYRTVLGSAESGSIGKETKRILSAAGIYRQALQKTLYLTTDSKGLSEALSSGKADLVMNWYATALWHGNESIMTPLRLDEQMAPPHKLIIGLLSFAYHREIAVSFIEYASSPQGIAIFERYGFGK